MAAVNVALRQASVIVVVILTAGCGATTTSTASLGTSRASPTAVATPSPTPTGSPTSTWQVVSANAAAGASLSGVTCVTDDDCWAVGGNGADTVASGPLIENYSGGTWSVVASPALSGFGTLAGISCPAADDCWAVGDVAPQATDSQSVAPVLEQYSGGSWAIVPGPPLTGGGYLTGISCPTAGSCWAVGTSFGLGETSHETLIEQYSNGVWNVAASPPVENASLGSVACPTANDCWAVGGGTSGGTSEQTLILHYTGGSWTADSFATPGGLMSVSCISADDCWAAGSQDDQPLVIQSSGSGWATVEVPTITGGGQLDGLDCVATDHCWAVGTALGEEGEPDLPLVEEFDGSGWIQASGPTVAEYAALDGVTSSGSGGPWAVGYSGQQYAGTALIETGG
jgi:hypothetical protein